MCSLPTQTRVPACSRPGYRTKKTKNHRLLEMGCGAGVAWVLAAQHGCDRVVALDINPAAVENTRRNAARYGVTD
ncbi:MAG: 50S ribosomal protein L11 methyltransferase, partial [Actinobacteria bacterium]|nr:50S ribosomal protein L11 methyltransferase [Actinomycetota bacterium]